MRTDVKLRNHLMSVVSCLGVIGKRKVKYVKGEVGVLSE